MGSRLLNKVALITGAGSGMGEAQALLFASEGATVVLADIREEHASRVAIAIQETGAKALVTRLDVTDPEGWRESIEFAKKELGRIDVLCNNAGTNVRVSFEEQTYEQYRRIMQVNLDGAYLGCKAVGNLMGEGGGGAILNIGSLASLHHGGSTGYTLSKTGVIALTKNVALGYADRNIRCNAVCPGHVDTPFLRNNEDHSPNDWSTSINNPENYNRRLESVPLKKLQTPKDIAYAGLFLCSDEASMITGGVLTVDGGTSLL